MISEIGIGVGLAASLFGLCLVCYALGYRAGQHETEDRWSQAVVRGEEDRRWG